MGLTVRASRVGKGVDQVDRLIDTRDQFSLNLNAYDRSTAAVLTQRKSKLMAFKMGKEIRENLKRKASFPRLLSRAMVRRPVVVFHAELESIPFVSGRRIA